MDFIVANWPIMLLIVIIIGIIVFVAVTQPKKIREWLIYATTEAEKNLGGGTGQLKLRQVYDMFITKFPWLSAFISFDYFSYLVDDALKEMREMLSTNEAVANYVTTEK